MFILGVTGGIGCGKTAATERFSDHGITVVDADTIAHQIVEPGEAALEKIVEHFGKHILQLNGELNRQALRHIIFENDKEREWLENYLHPLIRSRTLEEVKHSQSPYTILSAPLLLEKNLTHLVDRVLVIDCSEAIQIDRTCRRDNSSIPDVQKIMQQQVSRRERLAKADDVITNNGSLDSLYNAVDQYHFDLIKKLNNKEQLDTINK